MDRRIIYGSEEFARMIKEKYDVKEVIKPKGRPRKDDADNK